MSSTTPPTPRWRHRRPRGPLAPGLLLLALAPSATRAAQDAATGETTGETIGDTISDVERSAPATLEVPTLEQLAARAGRLDEGANPDGQLLDLSLGDALRIALENNLDLQLAEVTARTAEANAIGSWGNFDPVFSTGATYTDGNIPQSNPLITGGVSVLELQQTAWQAQLSRPLEWGGTLDLGFQSQVTSTNSAAAIANEFTDGTLFLTYVQPLLRGFGRDAVTVQQRADEIQWRVTLEQARERRETLLQEVSNSYWDLVAAVEELRVRELSVQLGERQLEQNRERLRVGVGTEVDVLQAETNVATQQESQLLAETDVESRMDALKRLLFRRSGAGSESFEQYLALWELPIVPRTPLPDTLDAAANLAWRRSLATALEYRPELNQSRLAVDSAELRLNAAESQSLPQLDLSLDVRGLSNDTSTGDAYRDAFSLEFPTTTGGLSFSMPIFNRTRSNAERAARLDLVAARLGYEQLENTVLAEVRDAVRRLEDGAEIVSVSRKASDLARRQLEAEETSYREGLSTTFQVLEFQQQLAQALSREKRALADFAKAGAALERAEGRLSAQVELEPPAPEEVRQLELGAPAAWVPNLDAELDQ